jgi:hypothetical protein
VVIPAVSTSGRISEASRMEPPDDHGGGRRGSLRPW